MASDCGGVATVITPRRLTSQHSSLRDSFIASDLVDAFNNEFTNDYDTLDKTTCPRRDSNLTLGAVLNSDKKSPPPPNVVVQTLLDIFRNEETIPARSVSSTNSKTTWKSFKERLKLKRNQSQGRNQNQNSWHRGLFFPVPQSDLMPSSRSSLLEELNRKTLRSSSLRQVEMSSSDDMAMREGNSGGSPRIGGSFRLSSALAVSRDETRRSLSRELDEDNNRTRDDDGGGGSLHGDGDEDEGGVHRLRPPSGPPTRMSLMDLLEETNRQGEISRATYMLDGDDEEVEVEKEGEYDGKEEFSCCVCMVRHKGATFIPCGHTFCRLCSRVLFAQR